MSTPSLRGIKPRPKPRSKAKPISSVNNQNGNKTRGQIEIESLGFPYREVSQYKLDQLSTERRVQVRDSQTTSEFAPPAEVNSYAIMMGQKPFDPIIVTHDAWLVEGNTR